MNVRPMLMEELLRVVREARADHPRDHIASAEKETMRRLGGTRRAQVRRSRGFAAEASSNLGTFASNRG